MGQGRDTNNQVHGGDLGAVVQAGSIDRITIHGRERPHVVPRQLPLAVPGFTGRSEHLAALAALLPGHGADAGAAVVISAVDGTAGVGKTTLAVHWAHRVQHHFPDGLLFADLRGYGPGAPATPQEVLPGFLHALGIPPGGAPPSPQAQVGLYRSILAGRRVLIVLDNANAADQVRPLLPGSPGCLVLITSRAALTGLVIGEAATRLTLDLLTPVEARRLLVTTLGHTQVAADPEATDTLIRYCARLPLALRVAAAQAETTLGELVAEMADERTRLDLLSDTGDPALAVRTVFAHSYRQLTKAQARLFRRLGLHPGPEFGLPVAAAIAGTSLALARRLLTALTNARLLQRVARDRYRFHDLLRAYAAELADTEDHPSERARLRQVLLEWYAHHTKTADRLASPAFSSYYPYLGQHTEASPEITFKEAADAWMWAEAERDNLVAAARTAAEHDLYDATTHLTTAMVRFLDSKGRSAELWELNRLRLTAARRAGDRVAECDALMTLGEALRDLSRMGEALCHFQDALGLARELNAPWREACALLDLGHWCNRQERYPEALSYLDRALPLSRGAQQGRLEGTIESNLSLAHTGLGDFEQALHHAERALPLHRQADNTFGVGWTLDLMARAHLGLDSTAEAISLCKQALPLCQHWPYFRAEVLETLGICLRHQGDVAGALACWREALALFEDFGHHRTESLRARFYALEATEPADQ